MAATTERLDKDDRQIAAIRDLMREGVRLMVETRKDLRTLAGRQLKLEAAQERTDKTLRDFISSMRHGGNGHAKGQMS
jgi:hypothetical protein